MKKSVSVSFLLIYVGLLSACAKPDRVVRANSPNPSIFFTVETWHGHGASDNDFTRVYAHIQRGDKAYRELVLDGNYLEDTKITWLNPDEVMLCLPDGYTNTFRNHVTLSAGGDSEMIRSHLREHCTDNLVPSAGNYNEKLGSEGSPPHLQRK